VFSMTPEVGSNNDGFWPSQNAVLGICRENVFQNYAAAQSLLDNYELTDLSSSIIASSNFSLDFELQRLGLQNTDYTLNLTALDATITGVNNPQVLTGLDFGMIDPFIFTGVINPVSVQNSQITFVVSIATANYTFYDTIIKFYGNTQIAFQDNDGDMSAWSSTSTWGKDNDAYSPPSSTSDSPNGNYNNSQNQALISNVINLTDVNLAILEFYAKWDIEKGYDYAQVSASSDGGTSWTPLCGQYTVIGNNNQDENQPLYDGVQNSWVKESIDLTDFIGENIQLRFSMVSDNFTRGDGFKFDDMKVLVVQDSTQTGIRDQNAFAFQIYPNPTINKLTIVSDVAIGSNIVVRNVLGQEMLNTTIISGQTILNVSTLSLGTYFVYIENESGKVGVRQFVIMD